MVMTPYDELVVLGDTTTTREEIFCDVVASAFLPTRNVTRCAPNNTWFSSELSMVRYCVLWLGKI